MAIYWRLEFPHRERLHGDAWWQRGEPVAVVLTRDEVVVEDDLRGDVEHAAGHLALQEVLGKVGRVKVRQVADVQLDLHSRNII